MKKKGHLFRNLLILLVAISVQNCKKDPVNNTDKVDIKTPSTGTRTELTLDSIYLYARQTYLWYQQLPGYDAFNPRKYASNNSDEQGILNKELFDLTRTAINPQSGQPYEAGPYANYPKYSSIDFHDLGSQPVSSFAKLSDISLEGDGIDYGFRLTAVASSDVRIRFVEPNSPAAKAGLARGWRVLKIGKENITANTSTAFLEDAFSRSQMALTVQKPDGSTATVNLSQEYYESDPVYKSTVIHAGGKSIGYIAYRRFSNTANSQGPLDEAFKQFATAGVQDLVVDLRYNGGGYVTMAEHMLNLIIPSNLNGQVMFIEHYNDLMSTGKATILQKQQVVDENNNPVTNPATGKPATYYDIPWSDEQNTSKFQKAGELNSVKNVYFIVSGNTASASELVINSLRPYLNVKIIGTQTYGKPVGFFPIHIDKYDVYMPNFESRNSKNEGQYYSGFTPDAPAQDDVTRDFGDPNEICLSKAIAYATTGSPLTANTKMTIGNKSTSSTTIQVKNLGTDRDFKGMIENRLKFKKQ